MGPSGPADDAGASSSRRASPPGRRPSPAEVGLLELARALATPSTPSGERESLTRALGLLEAAFAPDAPLPGHLARAWLRTRADKTAALALGWAREQVRRALAEVIGAALPPGRRAAEVVSPDLAAWLLLAAAEGESHEVGGTVGDRLRMVWALLPLP